MKIRFSGLLLLSTLLACAPTSSLQVAKNPFPIETDQVWFILASDEGETKRFSQELRFKGQPQKVKERDVWYFDDNFSFLLKQPNAIHLLVRSSKTPNYNNDEAVLCEFHLQINPIGDGTWAGSSFFGTTNGAIKEANETPDNKQIGFCALQRLR
jgi:hypothetical protein